MLVIDDHLLLALLLERPTRAFDRLRAGKRVFTTGLWYHRMCRALTASEVSGALSAQLGAVEPAVARQAIAAAIELPPTIGLVSLRDLSWPMAEILTSISANLLTLEALAAARHLQAKIVVAKRNDGPQLRRHAQQLAISVRSI